MTVNPFDHDGKPVSRDCPDPNCGGTLQHQGDGIWTCDGLTFNRDDSAARVLADRARRADYVSRGF